MKKLTAMLSLVLLLTLVLTACGGQEAPAEQPADSGEAAPAESGEVQPASEIVVFNWSEYIDPEIYAMFEEEYGKKVTNEMKKGDLEFSQGLSVIVSLIWAFWIERRKPTTIRAERIGRNDPCPCGSGKKFKKCCGAMDS